MTTPLTVFDPRPPRPAGTRRLAPRPGGYGSGDRVVLFDNGKLGTEYGTLGLIAGGLRDGLAAAFPGADLVARREDLLARGTDRCAELARELAAEGVAAVVLGLCDWGVSLPTALLAAELEGRGVPTATVALEVGRTHTTVSGRRLLPGLPVVTLPVTRHSPAATVTAAAAAAAAELAEVLTLAPDRLLERAARAGGAGDDPAFRSPDGVLTVDGADPVLAFTAAMAERGLGDGLPLVPPTPERIEAFLRAAGRDGEEEVWPAVPPRDTPVRAREVAAVAVLAGCAPSTAPVLLAAYEAMADPAFRLFQAAVTTHPAGTLVLVSGPDPAPYGISSGAGCLGPGHPANATVGRAVALGSSFLLGARAGSTDMTAQGSPAEFAYCCAEAVDASPWPGLHAELGHGDATTVTVLKAEGPHAVLDSRSVTPEGLLGGVADTMATLGGNNAYVPGAQSVVLLNSEHAAIVGDAGWTRADVRRFLFARARNPRAELAGRGIAPLWPPEFDGLDPVPVATRAEDLLVAVAGGPGPSSQVVLPWGYSRGVTRAVRPPAAPTRNG